MNALTLHAPEIPGVLSGDITRIFRVLKPQPSKELIQMGAVKWCGEKDRETFLSDIQYFECNWKMPGFVRRIWPNSISPGEYWVRETWASELGLDFLAPRDFPAHRAIFWRADAASSPTDASELGFDRGKWRSPVTMPRWASRASIRVTDVRVHRAWDIHSSECACAGAKVKVDALKEAMTGTELEKRHAFHRAHTTAFATLFNAINGPSAWEQNPWVCGAQVERIER